MHPDGRRLSRQSRAYAATAGAAKATTARSLISCEGRSAGGLLVGAALNDAPSLWRACIAGVPFVDVMTSMCVRRRCCWARSRDDGGYGSSSPSSRAVLIARARAPRAARRGLDRCDPSIPLTTGEWEEWGNPNEVHKQSNMMQNTRQYNGMQRNAMEWNAI